MKLLKEQSQVDVLSLEQVKEYYKFPVIKKQWLHNDETTVMKPLENTLTE
mgnify:CR=1 FL=1